MNEKQFHSIVEFINKKYSEEIPRPVKFVIRRKAKRIQSLTLDEFPEDVLKCTIEELIIALKKAYEKNLLKF